MLQPLLVIVVGVGCVVGQVKSSWPRDYPGKPSGDFSPGWQNYFEVTNPLPNVTFPLGGRSFAGSIPVDRQGHPNNTLFFWAFEKENGSLSDVNSTEPWGIWLNGGPGSSSFIGLFVENGPLHVESDYSIRPYKYSWDRLADFIWIDQPVGTGFSTADALGFIKDEDQMGTDFMNFLANLVKVFPGLKTRPLYLTGESYAGTYIPYITRTYFGLENPPVNLKKIAIGDGALGNFAEFMMMPVISVIETYPQVIAYDPEVYKYFKEQWQLCGYDLNVTYPQQNGHFRTLQLLHGKNNDTIAPRNTTIQSKQIRLKQALLADNHQTVMGLAKREVDEETLAKRDQWKRDLTGRANEGHDRSGFDLFNVPDALWPQAAHDASVFLNDNRTRAAIHAPTSKDWQESIDYPFGSDLNALYLDPSDVPMAFLTELATNATERGVHIIMYSGNDDPTVAHWSTEVIIQNTTFGGTQGFTKKPSTPWYGDDGSFAGIVHQERNWTYVLFKDAGHLLPQQQPERAFVFMREFVLGNNRTGLVTDTGETVGGEDPKLAGRIMPGQLGIYVGSATTESTYTFPSATIAAWSSFFASVTATTTSSAGDPMRT